MNSVDVILIGPSGVGKTTIAKLLAERLALKYISLDEIRFRYYAEVGYDELKARQPKENDYEELLRYWQPFDAHAVERALAEHQNCVFDFGAIHSVYDDPALTMRVSDTIAPYRNVILLMPSEDKVESVRVLHERGRLGFDADEATLAKWLRIIRRFVMHPSNERLAKRLVYTKGRSPDETLLDILRQLNEA